MTNSTSRVRVGSLVDQVRGSVEASNLTEGDYILLEHISQKTGEVSPSRVELEDVKSAKGRFEAGDILFGKLRPQLRKVCVVEQPGFCSLDILVLRPRLQVGAYHLAAVLRSESFSAQVSRLTRGANLPRVGAKELLDIEIDWPDEHIELARRNFVAKEALAVRSEMRALNTQISQLERSIT